jgi:hypothetical protein
MNPREQYDKNSILDDLESVISPLGEESEEDLFNAEQKQLKESLLQKLLFFASENRFNNTSRSILYAIPVSSQIRPGGTNYDCFSYNFAPSVEAFEREHLPKLSAFAQPGALVHMLTVDTRKLQDGIDQLLEVFNAKTIGQITEHYGGLPYTFFNAGVVMVVEPSVSIKTYRIGGDHTTP